MIRLLDGPAKLETWTRRAPQFLRCVVDADGKIDVLDLLTDAPRPSERVFVYRAVKGTTTMRPDGDFACVDDGQGGYKQVADARGDYRWLPAVDGETLRETEAWRTWVQAQPADAATG